MQGFNISQARTRKRPVERHCFVQHPRTKCSEAENPTSSGPTAYIPVGRSKNERSFEREFKTQIGGGGTVFREGTKSSRCQ